MADPRLDPRHPDSPYHVQETVEAPPERPPEKTPPNVGGMALVALFILVLVAGGFVFAFGGFRKGSPVEKPAPGVTYSQPATGTPSGPNALAPAPDKQAH